LCYFAVEFLPYRGESAMASKPRIALFRMAEYHLWLLGLQLIAAGIMLGLAGCSTAPCADILDFCSPGRFPAKAKDTTGGVCIPQGGPAGGVLGGPPTGAVIVPGAAPIGPTGVPDVPPPAPIGMTPTPGMAN
jgi:hypothetical protein